MGCSDTNSNCGGGDGGGKLFQFTNCRVLYRNEILREDFWVRDGKIMNPEELFYSEKVVSDVKIDCDNLLIVPGYLDLQINGGFGYDFSSSAETLDEAVHVVAKGLFIFRDSPDFSHQEKNF